MAPRAWFHRTFSGPAIEEVWGAVEQHEFRRADALMRAGHRAHIRAARMFGVFGAGIVWWFGREVVRAVSVAQPTNWTLVMPIAFAVVGAVTIVRGWRIERWSREALRRLDEIHPMLPQPE